MGLSEIATLSQESVLQCSARRLDAYAETCSPAIQEGNTKISKLGTAASEVVMHTSSPFDGICDVGLPESFLGN